MCRKKEGRKGGLKELFRGGGGGGGGKGLSSLVFMGRGREKEEKWWWKGRRRERREREDRQGISSAFSSLFCSYVQHSRFHFYRKFTVLLVDFRAVGD